MVQKYGIGEEEWKQQATKTAIKEEQYTEVIYRIKGSSINIHKFPKLRVWNGSGQQFETLKDVMEEESIGTDSDNNPDVIDINLSSQCSASQPDYTVYEGNCLFPAAKSDSTSSLSSSSPSRSSDEDDLFRVNVNRDFNLTTSSSPSSEGDMDIKPASDKHNKVYVISRNSSTSSEEMENNSPHQASISQASDLTNESSMPLTSPTQSPPIQVMDPSTGYDPSRIPPSAFARRGSTTPQEWSVASNDSLFSIHIGNASFARENAVIGDMHKSGELTKSRELPPQIPLPPSPNAAFKTDNSPKRPSVPVVDIEKPPKETENSGAIEVAAITAKNPVKPTLMDQNNGYKSGSIPSKSFNKSKQLDGEKDKASPLPVRKKKGCCACFSRSTCSCSSSFWSCTRPKLSSCFRWPTSCHCWSRNLKNCCWHSSSEWDEMNGSKPEEGKTSTNSTNRCCTKAVCCNCVKLCCSSPKSSCFSCTPFCSCSKPSYSGCFSKPSCCCSFLFSSCFSCWKWPCSYHCSSCCC